MSVQKKGVLHPHQTTMFERSSYFDSLGISHLTGVFLYMSFFILPIFSSPQFSKSTSKEKRPSTCTTVSADCNGSLGSNLYPSGSFGAGLTSISPTDPGICPNYTYEESGAPADSFYTLTNNTGSWTDPQSEGNWKDTGDNSADPNGYMMVVNLLEDPHVFIVDSIEVCAGLTYNFSFDALNLLYPEHEVWADKADIEILINSAVVYDTGELPQDTAWHTHEFLFSIPTGTKCVFEFRNKSTINLGGDIAIDNISIADCTPDLQISTQHSSPLCEYEAASLIAQIPSTYDGFDISWLALENSGWQKVPGHNSDTLNLDSVWLEGPVSYRYQLTYPELSLDPNCQLLSEIYTFDLIPRAFTSYTQSICEWDDRFSSEGNQRFYKQPMDTLIIDTLIATTGCDSIVHLQVFTFFHDSFQQLIDLCEGDSVIVGSAIYKEGGSYTDTLTTYDGCDSVVYTQINFLLDQYTTVDEYICEGDTFRGEEYYQDSILQDTLIADNGCKLFQQTNIHVFPNIVINLYNSIQEGESYNKIFYTQDTLLTDSLMATNGCDSIVYTYLEVRPDFYSSERVLVCEGSMFQDRVIYRNTAILDTLESSIQSDSFILYDVRVLEQDTIINRNYSCDDIEQGIEELLFTNQFGCDSLVINVNIYLGDPDTTKISQYTCDPGQAIYEEVLFQNLKGCDSLVINETIFAPSYETVSNFDLCEGDYYEGNLLTQDTMITETLLTVHGCDSIINIRIAVHPAVAVSIEKSNTTFCKETGMTLIAESNAQVIWSTGSEENAIVLNEGGWYFVEAENQYGCKAVDSILINAPIELLGFPMPNSPSCLGLFDGSILIADVQGGSPPYLYSIDGFNFQSSPLFGNLEPGNYEITIEASSGCQFVEAVEVEEQEALFLDLGEDIIINEGEQGQFKYATNAETIDSLWWTPFLGLNCKACKYPSVSPTESTLYTLTIMDKNGCTASDDIFVEVIASFIYVPTVFSPNGDGINDYFTIFCDIEKVSQIRSFKIYDRWGGQMFYKKDFQHSQELEGWNGKYKGRYLQSGVFIYAAEILLKDGTVLERKGDFMIMR